MPAPKSELPSIRVLLTDDYAMIRDGLELIINGCAGMEVVAQAANGRVALRKAQQYLPHIVVLDIAQPVAEGVTTVRQIKRLLPNVGVLVLSPHEDVAHVREMVSAGASGYVLERSTVEDLLCAIRTVAGGGVFLDASLGVEVVSDLIGTVASDGAKSIKDSAEKCNALTERQSDVLRRTAQGYSNKEIAVQYHLSVKTVETYKAQALEKLAIHHRVDIVSYALSHGWFSTYDTITDCECGENE